MSRPSSPHSEIPGDMLVDISTSSSCNATEQQRTKKEKETPEKRRLAEESEVSSEGSSTESDSDFAAEVLKLKKSQLSTCDSKKRRRKTTVVKTAGFSEDMTEYEKDRLEKIERNKEILASLKVLDVASELKSSCAPAADSEVFFSLESGTASHYYFSIACQKEKR